MGKESELKAELDFEMELNMLVQLELRHSDFQEELAVLEEMHARNCEELQTRNCDNGSEKKSEGRFNS